MSEPRTDLEILITQEAIQPVSAEAGAIADALARRHGPHLVGVLFYGSCLRPPSGPDEVGPGGEDERLFDFYAVVDDLRSANDGALAALGNRLLPPNVFYLEVPFGTARVRTKYAVVSFEQLRHGVSTAHFHNYFWGRFCQPTTIPWARDVRARHALIELLAGAVVTMVRLAAPLVPERFTADLLWTRAFTESYRCELRPESAERPAQIFRANAARYRALTPLALAAAGYDAAAAPDGTLTLPLSADERRRARRAWRWRRVAGKTFNVLRLMKAAFTFSGGTDYIAWKIERHSGVRPQFSPWQRRHPILAAPLLAWRYWRRGAFR